MRLSARSALFSIMLGLALALPGSAFAISLDEAKTKGLVGETPSGYLDAVQSPSPEVRALMDDVNGKRRRKYQEIAKSNGTALNVVEALAGKKAVEETGRGRYIKLPSGQWVKK